MTRARTIICELLTLAIVIGGLWGCQLRTTASVDAPRSSCWKKARAEFIASHPKCEACGAKAEEIHHEVPFSTDASLECEPSNLIALCHSHHFEIGHCRNYQFHNPNVRRDVERYREMIANRKPNKVVQ